MSDIDPTFVEGLSLRDYYAGLIMQGIAARDKKLDYKDAQLAFSVADLMLEVRDGNT